MPTILKTSKQHLVGIKDLIVAGRGAAAWGWYTQLVTAFNALISIPILARSIGTDAVGLWLSIWGGFSIALQCDFGLGTVLSRQISYSHTSSSGNSEASPVGNGIVRDWTGVDGINKAFGNVKFLNRRFAALAAFLLAFLTCGVYFTQDHGAFSSFDLKVTLVLAGSSIVLVLLSRPYHAIIEGLNSVGISRAISGHTMLLCSILQIVLSHFCKALYSLAIPMFVSSLASYICARKMAITLFPQLRATPTGSADKKSILKISWPLACLNLAGFLHASLQVPVVGLFISTELAVGLFFAQRLLQSANMIAMQTMHPQLINFTKLLRSASPRDAYMHARYTLLRIAILLGIANISYIAVYWSTSSLYSSKPLNIGIAIAMAIDLLIANIGTAGAWLILASGRNPFLLSAVTWGIGNIVLFVIAVPHIGLWAVPLSSFIMGLVSAYRKNFSEITRLLNDLRGRF